MMPKTLAFVVTLSLFSLGEVPVSAQDPAQALAKLQEARKDILKLGSQARTELSRARRRSKKQPAARALFTLLRKEVKGVEAAKVEKDEVKKRVALFAASAEGFVASGEKGLAVTAKALEGLSGDELAFVERAHQRCIAKEAIDDMKEFIGDDGQVPGNFNGMFDDLRRFEEMPAVFLDLFVDVDQDNSIRTLAGEGVAQFFKPNDKPTMEAVRAVMNGSFEEDAIKTKAKWVLCRLGDEALMNKELSQWGEQLKTLEPKAAALGKERVDLVAKVQALDAKADASVEDKAASEKYKAEINKKTQELVQTVYGLFIAHQQTAWTYMQVIRYGDAEAAYERSVEKAMSIFSFLSNNPNFRGTVSNAFYNLACAQSKQGKAKVALSTVERACMFGYNDFGWIAKDGDLASMRELPEYEVFVKEMKSGARQKKWRLDEENRMKAAQREAERQKAEAQKAKSGGVKPTPKPVGAGGSGL